MSEGTLSVAPLRNVATFSSLMEKMKGRSSNLPGIAAFYAKTGVGKTQSAIYSAIKHKAYYVQVKETWTRKYLCTMILKEMGIKPEKTLPEMVDQISEQLSASKRPLIIDEADYLIKKNMIEIIRDIYEGSLGVIVLIGEENLPKKLKQFERFSNRVLHWVQALPIDMTDSVLLAKAICPQVTIEKALLEKICTAVEGCARRFVVNLEHVREYAMGHNLEEVTVANYQEAIDTGTPWR